MTNSDEDLNDEYTISHNYHYENQAGVPQSSHTWTRSNTSYATGFHTLGIEWEPGRISWFVDGIETKRFTGPLVASTPQFLVFSLQIGHAPWIGQAFEPDATTPFPSYMQVNWVRVWQR
jgi:beta-glucanase (GH16 family)